MYNIIVIDDHQMLRDMISETLNSQDDLNVVATAGNAKDSLELCKKSNPDLVLMDVCTENNSNGIAYSKLLKKQFPKVKVIIMTGVLDLNFINDAKEAGIDTKALIQFYGNWRNVKKELKEKTTKVYKVKKTKEPIFNKKI